MSGCYIYISRVSKRYSSNVPAYFIQQAAPIISYTYASTIASKIFNHRKTLQHLNIDDPRLTPVCSCSSSPFNYNTIGHVITGNLAVATNDKLRNTLRTGPKYREPKHIIGIRISNYLWIPLRIMPGNGQNRRRWNLTHSLTE